MTGFGNNALNALLDCSFVNLVGVFAPLREDNVFPYYKCEKLHDVASGKGITLYGGRLLRDDRTCELIKNLSPDLIVVSSFRQIIPESFILLPKLGVINVHPSLLPKYRGATPTVWALMNGEQKTGVTIHFVEDETFDRGRIIAQASVEIDPLDNDGTLRFKLAILSEKVLIEALDQIVRRDKEAFPQQDESQATYYPKRSIKDGEIDIHRPFKEILNRIRAMSPYPGAYLNFEGTSYLVTGAALLNGKGMDIKIIENREIVVHTIDGAVKFQIGKEN
jgi:methionyl-tRNA formyltransferase